MLARGCSDLNRFRTLTMSWSLIPGQLLPARARSARRSSPASPAATLRHRSVPQWSTGPSAVGAHRASARGGCASASCGERTARSLSARRWAQSAIRMTEFFEPYGAGREPSARRPDSGELPKASDRVSLAQISSGGRKVLVRARPCGKARQAPGLLDDAVYGRARRGRGRR